MSITKDLILKKILLINFDEEKKTYKENQIDPMFADKNVDDKAIIIVCTQQSMSGTSNHFQESFKKWITRTRTNGIEFKLLSKVDATRQKNRISITGQISNNVRTRVYYNPNKVNINFDKTKFETSYNKNTESRGGIRSVNTSWSNTRTANLYKNVIKNVTDFTKIQLFDYSIQRLSGQNNNKKPIIGQGLIDVNLYFVYVGNTGNYLMKFTVRNYNGYKSNINLIKTNSNKHVSKSATFVSGDEYKYICSKNTTKEKIVNERHGKIVKIKILNKSNFPKPVQKNSQVMPINNRQIKKKNGYQLVNSTKNNMKNGNKSVNPYAINGTSAITNNNSDNELIQEVVKYTSNILLYNTNITFKNNQKKSEEYKKLIAICDSVLLISKLVFETDKKYAEPFKNLSNVITNSKNNKKAKIIFNKFINFKDNYSTLKMKFQNSKSQNKYIKDFNSILYDETINRKKKVQVLFFGQNNLNKRFNKIFNDRKKHNKLLNTKQIKFLTINDYKKNLGEDLLYLEQEIIKLVEK